jgi:hypothetical protein
MKDYEKQLKATGAEIKQHELKIAANQNEASTQLTQMTRLQKKIDDQSRRLRLIPVFDRTNILLAKRLYDLSTAVADEEDTVLFEADHHTCTDAFAMEDIARNPSNLYG